MDVRFSTSLELTEKKLLKKSGGDFRKGYNF